MMTVEHHHHDLVFFQRPEPGDSYRIEYDLEQHLLDEHGCRGLKGKFEVADYFGELTTVHGQHHPERLEDEA